uniref:Uncharacterized protein n=1 Tax=Astatotilapia calliptera TaxID=8154 RepID=A0AAX7SK96_ASTCA
MPFPFGKSHKSPADIVKNLKDSMTVLEKHDISDKKAEKATEEVSKSLVAMKEILYGTNEKEPQTEAVAQLAQELYNSGLLSTLIADLQLIDFEFPVNSAVAPMPIPVYLSTNWHLAEVCVICFQQHAVRI